MTNGKLSSLFISKKLEWDSIWDPYISSWFDILAVFGRGGDFPKSTESIGSCEAFKKLKSDTI